MIFLALLPFGGHPRELQESIRLKPYLTWQSYKIEALRFPSFHVGNTYLGSLSASES